MFSLFRRKSAPALALRQPLPHEDDAEVVMVELRGTRLASQAPFSVTSAPQKALVGQTAKFVVSAPPDVAYRYRFHIEHRAGVELGANETATEHCTPWQDFPELFYCFDSSGVYAFHVQVSMADDAQVLTSIYLDQSFVLPNDIMALLVSNSANHRLSILDIPTDVYRDPAFIQSLRAGVTNCETFFQRVVKSFAAHASVHASVSPHAHVRFALHAMNVVAALWVLPNGNEVSRAALALEDHALDDDAKLRVMLAAKYACCMDTAMLLHMLLTRYGIRNQFVQIPGHVLNQIITPDAGTWLLDGYTNIAMKAGIVEVINGHTEVLRFRYPHCNLLQGHPHYCTFISRFRDYMQAVYGSRLMASFAINYGDNLPRDYKTMAQSAKQKLTQSISLCMLPVMVDYISNSVTVMAAL